MRIFKLIRTILILILLHSGSSWANLDSTTWTSNGAEINPAIGYITSGGNTTNIQLTYGAYINAGQLFTANWSLVAGNLGTITPGWGMPIGYTRTPTHQTINFSQAVTNPYLMFEYVDAMSFDFSSVGSSNVKLINSNGVTQIGLSNGIVTVAGTTFNSANDGFVVQLTGTFTTIDFVTTLSNNSQSTEDTSVFAIAVDAPLATISGTMNGLANGQSAVLQNNGGDNLTVNTNGSFSFATPINKNSNYAVTVLTQPSTQFCTVQNAAGTATGNVTNIAVNCYLAPTVTAISPSAGPTTGGTTVTITGTNFVSGATTVTIGGNTCSTPVINSSTSLTCTAPAGTAGNASVVATTLGGSNSNNSLYTYTVRQTANIAAASGGGTVSAQIVNGSAGCSIDLANTTSFTPPTYNSLTPPLGGMKVKVAGCNTGETVTLAVTFSGSLTGLTGMKYGKTPQSPITPVWYQPNNLSISGNTITYNVTDNGLGDDTFTGADGVINDPIVPVPAVSNSATGIPTLNEWGLIALAGFLALVTLTKINRTVNR